MCGDGVRKGETHLLLNLLRDIKGNENGFCMHIRNKKKTRENASPLLNGIEHQVTRGMEKAKGLNAFPSILTSNICQIIVPEATGKVQSKEYLASVEEDQTRGHLNKY